MLHFQRNERTGHHALAAEERQDKRVVAREHRAQLGDAGAPESRGNRREQTRADSALACVGPYVDREHPAAGRRTELPVAHFADHEADDRATVLGDEELPLGVSGDTKLRTMLARDNTLILSFFRSQGMMAGPFIPLEMDLEQGRGGPR